MDGFATIERKTFELLSDKRVVRLFSENHLDNCIWPDFTSIPLKDNAILRLKGIKEVEELRLKELSVRIVPLNHTVYTVGFIIKEGGRGFMFRADTPRTRSLFEIAKKRERY